MVVSEAEGERRDRPVAAEESLQKAGGGCECKSGGRGNCDETGVETDEEFGGCGGGCQGSSVLHLGTRQLQAQPADVASVEEVVGVDPTRKPMQPSKAAQGGGFGGAVHQIDISWVRCRCRRWDFRRPSLQAEPPAAGAKLSQAPLSAE